jgi:uncharacterized RDD family membrane protein YckC
MAEAAASEANARQLRSNGDQAWARWIARSIDALLILAVSYGAWFGIGVYWQAGIETSLLAADSLDWALSPTLQMRIANTAMFIFLVLLIEPFFIGIAGATPGKWLMGIRVVRANGKNLGYGGALGRTLLVITLGLALYIPFVSFIAMVLQGLRVNSGQLTAWDDILDSRVLHVPRPPVLWLLLLAIIIGSRIALRWEELVERLA